MTKGDPIPQALGMASDAVSASPPEIEAEHLDFQAIFAGQFQYVWGALRRLGIPPRDLEDVTHDVFLRVYRQRHQYDPARPMRPWLFAFAFRVASDYRRLARHRREVLEPASENADSKPTAVDELVRAEMLSTGYAALETLEIGRRAVFILYELDGCSMQETALALGIPVNTAYSRLRLAREQFQASLGRMRIARGTR
jgi:RNA polymerase sigma-70 factor (ECF subfamily)